MQVEGPLHRDRPGGVVWVDSGHEFTFEDVVFFQGKGERDFDEVAPNIDLILTGPHASGAVPRELEPWVMPDIDERTQFDFSDHTTGPLSRVWAEIDPRVVYIEFPHHRVMFDPNRPPPDDIEAGLREFFARARAEAAGDTVSYNGVDAVRPISFGGVQFLREPADDSDWARFVAAVTKAGDLGARPYDRIKNRVLEKVFEGKAERLHSLDLSVISVSDFHSAKTLFLNCVHDTMQTTIGPDGAVNVAKPPDSTLPDIVSLGNRGDWRGEPRPTPDGSLMTSADVPTISGAGMRSVQRSLQMAFDIPDGEVQQALALNRPYLGAFEVQEMSRRLRSFEDRSIIRHKSGEGTLRIKTGAFQSEFQRELLLGPTNTAIVQSPGKEWPDPDIDHVRSIAETLARSFEILRRWDFEVPPSSVYEAPRFR